MLFRKKIKIASDNSVASDNKIALINIENDFSGLANAIAMFFPSMRNEMILRYRAETIAKVTLEAYRIAKNEHIKTNLIPPKIALPLIEKMSLEHEPDMYEKWAKLLIASSVNPNPIHQQYADILANLNNKSASLLKEIFQKQKDADLEKNYDDYAEKIRMRLLSNDIDRKVKHYSDKRTSHLPSLEIMTSYNFPHEGFSFPLVISGTVKTKKIVDEYWAKDKMGNSPVREYIILKFTNEENKMFLLLDKLGLIKYHFLLHKPGKEDGEVVNVDTCGILLTRFGYSFIECLENPTFNHLCD